MSADEIVAAVFGGILIIAIIVFFVFLFKSAEKTEEKKRDLMEQVTRYYKNRNEMFEKECNKDA